MQRIGFFVYGLISYLLTLAAIGAGVLFFGNFIGQSVDSAPRIAWPLALAINVALASVFALQHSGMARPAFKSWWTRFVPEAIERATYCLASVVAIFALYALWQPMSPVLWHVEGVVGSLMSGIYLASWAALIYVTYLIDHFDLFGLRQVYLHLRRRPADPPHFVTPSLYRWVRHPLYVAWLAIFWVTPLMTVGHLIFSVTITVYVLVAIQLEERDLEDAMGQQYADYRASTPMLIPGLAPSLPKVATSNQRG